MHLILTGATGLIGAGVLQQMLATESVTQISILSRRPVAMAEGHEDKAKVIIHKDFKNYGPEVLEKLKDASGVVWALGVSQNDVDKEQYREITYEYPLAAAKAFSTLHPDKPFTFVHVSGEGATQTPGMFTPIFGRVKGEIEQALFDLSKKLPNFNVYNMRPAIVDWRKHPEIHAFIPTKPWYYNAVLNFTGPLWPKSMMSPTRDLGRVLTELALRRGEPLEGPGVQMEGTLAPNSVLRRLAGI